MPHVLKQTLLCQKALRTKASAVFLLIVSCCTCENLTTALSAEAAGRSGAGSSLPAVFVSVLTEVKAKTSVPVLLPSELPGPFGTAKHATVKKAVPDEYAVSLYYELDMGDAGFAAYFAGKSASHFQPEPRNISEIKLTRGVVGFFRPVSCGGSCAPANLWWEQGGALYQIQLKLGSTLSEKKQQKIITEVANSAIQGGPR